MLQAVVPFSAEQTLWAERVDFLQLGAFIYMYNVLWMYKWTRI